MDRYRRFNSRITKVGEPTPLASDTAVIYLSTVLQGERERRKVRTEVKSLLRLLLWTRELVIVENDSGEKLGSKRKESVKLLKLFSKN